MPMEPIYRENDPGRKSLWIVIGVLAAVVAVLVFLLFERERLQQPPMSAESPAAPPESRREHGPAAPERKAQPADATPIVIAGQGGAGCDSEEPAFDAAVMAVGERASPDASEQPVYLQDRESVVRKYYLDLSGVPDAEKQRLLNLLTVGQHLKVRYVVCGNGGFRFLTFVQPAAAG
jgi:hypothetical protein